MESWVSTLIKDIKGKVGFPGNQLTRSNSSENGVSIADISSDYFPSGLSSSELRLLVQYLLKMRQINASHNLVNILGRVLFMEDLACESALLEPCLELDMSKMGHACIAVPLRERSWPPAEGYSYVCWFKYKNLYSQQTGMSLPLFSVSSTDQDNPYSEELYLKDGVLTLDINGTYSLSSSSLELEVGEWYHLAVIIGPVNALVAEHPSAIVYMYVDGNLRHTGELRYSPLLAEQGLLITTGVSAIHTKVSDLKWALRSFYMFEEQLSPECIHFLYFIGRGYKVRFQGVGGEDKSGDGTASLPTADEIAISQSDGKKTDFTLEMLENLWLELCGKKLIYAFNATRTEALPASQSLRLLNLADPVSFTFSPTGIPHSGHLCGDISICRRCVTGNIIHPFTGIAVVLALVESAETSDMLYIALTLLASTLHQNPQRAKQMKACKGYQLLSLFFRTRINLVDIQCLHILFKITVHEDSALSNAQNSLSSLEPIPEANSPEGQTIKILDELYLSEYHESKGDTIADEGTFSQHTESLDSNIAISPSFSGVISNGDLLEHVLLDWTIWVMASVSIQLEILNFFETLVSVYKYKDHNLITLHEKNIVQHLLLALHMDDIDILVMEKFAVLLTVLLEGKFLDSEFNSVTMFMLTTYDPFEVTKPLHAMRESKSKRVNLRNVLLEAFIDLQVTISSEELLEKWHSIVSSKLITYFLDEAVHPTTMGWIITILGMCLTSSSTFALKFEKSGGYQSLIRVLPKFNDSLDILYTLFCLIFSKPIYPKLPEVGILDFEALMTSNGDSNGLKFSPLLDSILSMVKSTFDQLRLKQITADHNETISEAATEEFVEGNIDIIEEVNGEASPHSSHALPVLGWDSAANATSILRFMANLAKVWPAFSIICARAEFLESCVDLYFSIVRTYLALKATSEHDFSEIVTESPLLASEGDDFWITESSPQKSSDETTHFMTSSRLLREIDNSGYIGDIGSAGATAVLDLISEVLSQSLIEQTNSFPALTTTLDSVPLNFDSETVLTFKALCLHKIMNYLERRLLNNDQREDQLLDNSNLWSNLGSFCSLIADCVYIGVFPQPSSVIRVLEFCLSILHFVKKDGQNEETSSLPWTGLLSIWRGSQPIDLIIKSTNRVILYCLLPSFLATLGEDGLISSSGCMNEERKLESPVSSREEAGIDICIVLELLHAHKEIVFHSGNLDVSLYSSLCIILSALFSDQRNEARNAAIGIMKYLITHCRASLEEILVSKPNQEKQMDILNGGFDKLLTENVSTFMEWFQNSEHEIKQVLQKSAGVRWSKYIEESTNFPAEKLAVSEDNRTLRLGKKVEDAAKLDLENRDEYIARRSDLEAKRVGVCSELEHIRQKKCESGSHAGDEWRGYLQQLGHEHKLENLSTMAWEDYWPLC
ncbi:protein SPIRRIG-like [Silene latifolia]|uniref:protein SPIRRIG-like n=1 Tax=Silene latifolia TaxID=37657 RepID=UPI003D788820